MILFFRKEEEMKQMKQITERAVNESAEAYNITKDAVNQQKNIRYKFDDKFYLFYKIFN